MARMPKPWRNATKGDAWYAQINRRKVRLADANATKRDAEIALARLIAGVPDDPGDALTVKAVAVQFLEHIGGKRDRGELAPETATSYARKVREFVAVAGDVPVDALKPAHVLAWLDSRKTWGSSIRWNASTVIKLMFNWARRVGLIDRSPIEHLEKPRMRRTLVIPTRETVERAMAACECDEFRLFLRVLYETGCRRSEAMRVEAQDIDWDRALWHRAGKTTAATGRERVVHLTPGLLGLLREQAGKHPEGPLLRNTKGVPWTGHAVTSRLRTLASKIPGGLPDMTLRSLRHLFATDALDKGVPIATVAELLGHATTQQVAKTYSHLSDRHDHLKEALHRVRPSAGEPVKKRRRGVK